MKTYLIDLCKGGMMKTRNIFLVGTVVILAIACGKSFTDLKPISERNTAEFYKSAQDFNTAIMGAYDGLQALYGSESTQHSTNGSLWILTEVRSDNTDAGGDVTGLAASLAQINTFTETPSNQYSTNFWISAYQEINRCNAILDRIDNIDMSDALKKQYKGETLFIRSLVYFHMAQLFGNIPLRLKEAQSIYETINQVPASDVYKQLITDLKSAISDLPASYSSDNVGRVTKGAAEALLGDVYLTTKDNQDAKSTLQSIVNSNQYSLLSNYADLWDVNNKDNAESIFEVHYKGGSIGEGSPFTNLFSPSSDLQPGVGEGVNRPSLDLVDAFEPGDQRFKISMDTSYVDPISGDTISSRYVKKYFSLETTQYDSDNDFYVYRYADVLLMLAEADGESPEAYGLINQVRKRAGLGPIDSSTPGTFSEKLLHERRVELAFENKRWYDLKRFGVAVQTMKNVTEAENEGNYAIDSHNLLYPIPRRELDATSELKQNDGYSQ